MLIFFSGVLVILVYLFIIGPGKDSGGRPRR
jgi:hypothetical protein